MAETSSWQKGTGPRSSIAGMGSVFSKPAGGGSLSSAAPSDVPQVPVGASEGAPRRPSRRLRDAVLTGTEGM